MYDWFDLHMGHLCKNVVTVKVKVERTVFSRRKCVVCVSAVALHKHHRGFLFVLECFFFQVLVNQGQMKRLFIYLFFVVPGLYIYDSSNGK